MKSTDKRRRPPDPDPKTCRGCGLVKPLAEFYKRNATSLRQSNWCRTCYLAKGKARIEQQRGYPVRTKEALPLGQQRCPRCTCVLPSETFGMQRNGRTRTYCPPCLAEYKRDYQRSHPEQRKAASDRYWRTHGSELRERQRVAYAKNPDRFAKATRKWKRRNTEAINASTHKRRARLKGGAGKWTGAEWKAIKARYDYRCLMCGRREPDIRLTVDHVIPVDLGGSNTIDNIQPLCRADNARKARRHLDLRPLTQSSF